MDMDLFCFASRNEENIWLGHKARLWAVATVSQSQMRGRATKAKKYLKVGSRGLLYCRPTQSFTVPFLVASPADPHRIVSDIWPEPWCLPFEIDPLGMLKQRNYAGPTFIGVLTCAEGSQRQ